MKNREDLAREAGCLELVVPRPGRDGRVPIGPVAEMPPLAFSTGTTEVNLTGGWKSVRPLYQDKTAPCQQGCPAGEDIARSMRAVQRGQIEWEDYSNFAMVSRFAAGAMGIPFMPIRSLLGSDVLLKQALSEEQRAADAAGGEDQRDIVHGLERSAGVIETLDIKIADELGVRSFELYSGGEAFRVNFAIRIGGRYQS